ncbi:MAG: hypothetical protein QOE35_1932 [Actinomycetota bacterium]|jgi:hypothetical protein
MLSAVARKATVVELSDVRTAAGLMLAGGAVRATMAHPVGIPCPLRTLTGIPCPLCGMTTSVTAVAHLDIVGAAAANPAGIAAVAAAVAVLVFHNRRTVTLPAWLIPSALVLMWLFELQRFHLI